MNKMDLKQLFGGLQKQMTSQLNTNREFITHPGSKGDALENTWIDWLRKYLPNRYNVDKAIIIDSEGNISHQIDVVIYDNWFTPFIFSQNGFHYIPVEGVYAVFEVKPDIKGNVGSDSFLKYAGEKIESVRLLKRTSTSMINSGRKIPPRAFTKIIGGFLCSSNSYSHKDNKTIESHIKRLSNLETIDIGCIADYGSFYVDYIGVEDTTCNNFDKRYLDYYTNRKFNKMIFSEVESSLVSFSLQLTRYLQQAIGTIPAIDLNAYSKVINFTIDEEI